MYLKLTNDGGNYLPERLLRTGCCSRYVRQRIPWPCRTRTWSRWAVHCEYRSSIQPSLGHDRNHSSSLWSCQGLFCRQSTDLNLDVILHPSGRRKSRQRTPSRCPSYHPEASSMRPHHLGMIIQIMITILCIQTSAARLLNFSFCSKPLILSHSVDSLNLDEAYSTGQNCGTTCFSIIA